MTEYYEDACEYGHSFREVREYGITSHYRCSNCGVTVSEERMEILLEDAEKEEADIVDDDDMC